MGNKSQQKKEKHSQRRKEKRKQEQLRGSLERVSSRSPVFVASNTRHRDRISRQVPEAWPDELAADVAIFDDQVCSTLPPELAAQAMLVREGMRLALEQRGDEAAQRLATIPRQSLLSEWRLFIRGLIDWQAENTTAANETWKRLDPERRPGRIATVMMLALQVDLEAVTPRAKAPSVVPSTGPDFDARQLYHAKLLRRTRFDRAALRVVEAGVNQPDESREMLVGPQKIKWLTRFIQEYRDTEPELATALGQTALIRAFHQNYSDIFEDAARLFRGPQHDPQNLLLTQQFYERFGDEPVSIRRAAKALNDYLKVDLPNNERLSTVLRGAIAAQLHLDATQELMRPNRRNSIENFLRELPDDNGAAIQQHLDAAIKAAPAWSLAYKTYVDWIEAELDDDRLQKLRRAKLELQLAELMQSWSRQCPEDVVPRLWLVDHLLENEKLDEARPHVEFLAAARHDDPRVRATAWKWQILEAMRLCRRKGWLAEVPARLDAAESLWPTWLPAQWLPYLRAAWALRCGNRDLYQQQRAQICKATNRVCDSLVDACMMLGAAQRMRVTGVELSPLRAACEQSLGRIDKLPWDDLIDVGSFFWDLHRVELQYPGYRAQAKTIGTVLLSRLQRKGKAFVIEQAQDERLQKAVLWCSEYQFWQNMNSTTLPLPFGEPAIRRHPLLVAAYVNALLRQQRLWSTEGYEKLGPLLRDAASVQRSAYYRYWFVELANQLDEIIAKESRNFFGFSFGRPAFDFDDSEDLGFDNDCDCDRCQAARRAHEQSAGSRTTAR